MQVIEDIFNYGIAYGRNGIYISIIVFAASVLVSAKQHKKNGIVIKRGIFSFFISFYIYMVIAITLLSRSEGSNDVLNLQLFSTFSNSITSRIFLIENVILFLPMGFFIGHVRVRKVRFVENMCICFCSSLFIELTQYITGRGKFEIDDIMTNLLGGVIGYLGCKGIKYIVLACGTVQDKSMAP